MPDAIRLEAVTKRYGSFTATQDVSLTVGEGEIFGFLGPNGAGKSTTTRILTTLMKPSAGKARVGGHDVVESPLAVRRIIGYLPERVPVYKNVTARGYLQIFARLHGLRGARARDRIETLLKVVNLRDVERRKVGGFSKGMTQRLGLARALLNKPRVLFLDEPASGLDPTGRKEIRSLMRSLRANGTTIFLCTHDLAEAQAVCDRIGFIREGRLVNVQQVSEAHVEDQRLLLVEIEGLGDAVFHAIRAVPGFIAVKQDGSRLEITFTKPGTRADLASAIQRAGGILLDMEEKRPTLESLYEKYVESKAQLSVVKP